MGKSIVLLDEEVEEDTGTRQRTIVLIVEIELLSKLIQKLKRKNELVVL